MKKIILAIILFVIFFLLFMNINKETIVFNTPKQKISLVEKNKDDKTPIKAPIKLIKKEHLIIVEKDESIDIIDKEVYSEIFTELPIEDVSSVIAIKKGITPILAFSMKEGILKNLSIGDKFDLPEINGDVYTLVIDTKINNPNGSVSLSAKLDNEDSKYFSVITEGHSSSFITIQSPEGIYEMESFNGKGYVYSSREIKNKWIDYSKKDYIISGEK